MRIPKINQELIDMELPIGTRFSYGKESYEVLVLVRKKEKGEYRLRVVTGQVYQGDLSSLKYLENSWTLRDCPWIESYEVPKVFTDEEYKEFFV